MFLKKSNTALILHRNCIHLLIQQISKEAEKNIKKNTLFDKKFHRSAFTNKFLRTISEHIYINRQL